MGAEEVRHDPISPIAAKVLGKEGSRPTKLEETGSFTSLSCTDSWLKDEEVGPPHRCRRKHRESLGWAKRSVPTLSPRSANGGRFSKNCLSPLYERTLTRSSTRPGTLLRSWPSPRRA